MNAKTGISAALSLILIVALTVIAFRVGQNAVEISLSLAIGILGLSLGWLSGIVASPCSDSERARFSAYARAIAYVLLGYAAAKLDAIVRLLAEAQTFTSPLPGFRFICFVAAFVIATTVTFTFRQYGRRS